MADYSLVPRNPSILETFIMLPFVLDKYGAASAVN